MPIVEFALTEGEKLCIKEDDTNIPKDKKIYALLNDNFYKGWITDVDGVTIDERWEHLLDTNEDVIYRNDRTFQENTENLQDFYKSTDFEGNKYQLLYRNYIKWDRECQEDKSTEMKKLAQNLNPINTLANAQLFLMVICFLSLLVLGITTPIFVTIRHCMVLRGEDKETYRDVIISTGIRIVNLIFIILKASFLISCLVLIKNYHNIYLKAKENDCTDLTTIYVLQYVDEYLDEAKNANWVSLSAVLVIGFCEITAIVVLFVLQAKSERSRQDARQSLLDSLAISKN